MIRHIVMWKLDSSYTIDEKTEIKKQLNNKLLHLLDEIDQVRFIEVNINAEKASQANFDIVLDSAFENMDDLKVYQDHPEHLKVVEYIKTLKLQKAAVDYEY
jgi:hypothetical protein